MSGKSSLTPTSKRRKSWKTIFADWASLVGFVALALYTSNTQQGHVQTQLPSKAKGHLHKVGPAEIVKNPGQFLKMTKKLTNPVLVEISQQEKGDIVAGKPFTMVGKVKIANPFKDLNIKWKIPKGVRIVDGPQSSHYVDSQAGDTKTLEITLVSETDDNLQIHLLAGAQQGNLRYSNSAQYNTTREKKIARDKAELVERNKAYIEATK